MKIIPVGQRLKDAGLAHPKLNALQADDTLYTVLALQPKGHIRITEYSIGHADSADAKRKMQSFFRLFNSLENQPDLVISPEYSVPWDALLDSIEADITPQLGKLWVLGCESLPLGGLAAIRERLGEKAVVLDDDVSPKLLTTQKYRNPLVYVFRTQSDEDQSERLVLLVQYKTEASGDPGNTEITGMLPGEFVYIFGLAPNEVRLMTLICSDVFGFNAPLMDEHYDGLLLLHIQLNNGPRHLLYKRYRPELFAPGGRTELVCLNWAENVVSVDQEGENEHRWNNICGSAWYLLPPEFDVSDERINENHRHGVYYTRHEPIRVHALQFHYRQRAFLFQTTKVCHHAIPKPRSIRSGPRVLKTFAWSEDQSDWTEPRAPDELPDDGFGAQLDRVRGPQIDLEDVRDLYRSGPVLVERAMAITAGQFGPKANWHEPPRIDSMQLCEQEIVRRVTVTQDPSPEASSFRSARLSSVRAIAELRGAAYGWPAPVEVLRQGFKFHWSPTFPNRNVIAENGTVATVVYAGLIGDLKGLEVLDQRARKTLAGPPPEPERALSQEQEQGFMRQHYATRAERLCILYATATGTKHYVSPQGTSFSRPAGQSAVDIGVPSFGRPAVDQHGEQE